VSKDWYDRNFRTLQATCALYKERHFEWPQWAAMDPTILQDLAFVLTTDGLATLARLIQLRTSDRPGISVGADRVVHADELRPVENVPDVQWLVFAEHRYKVELKKYGLDEVADLCAVHWERHGCWPTTARVSAAVAQQLAYVLAPNGFKTLGARLTLEVVDSPETAVLGTTTVTGHDLGRHRPDVETRLRAHRWLDVWATPPDNGHP